MKNYLTFIILMVFGLSMLNANNIATSNLILTGKNVTSHYTLVQFDISWENSFRVNTGPANWDAAWVFVKYRVAGGAWQHAWLNDNGHTAPSGSTIDIGLLTPGTAFNATTNPGMGAFIYRDADGAGTFTKTGVQLRWNYGTNGVADNAGVDIQVYAIETVYVPQGAFSLGDGGSEYSHFYLWPTLTNTYSVTDEAAIIIGTETNNLYYEPSPPFGNTWGDQSGPIPAGFPKGYNAFYCMKYEITQQGFVDFLNSLSYTQQATRTNIPPSSASGTYLYNTNRHKIKIGSVGVNSDTPAIYTTDYSYVACNYLNWADLTAYLDWSALRPMTELEFEKACRGTAAAVANEYAWGNATIYVATYTFSGSTEGTENEVVSNPGSDPYGNANSATNGGNIGGPLRVGSFATIGSNRIVSGATYYGIMEMSGNLWERAVTVGHATGRAYTGTHGNGVLTNSGDADVSTWPAIDAVGVGFRGGKCWNGANSGLEVSDRLNATNAHTGHNIPFGGRGVRLAP